MSPKVNARKAQQTKQPAKAYAATAQLLNADEDDEGNGTVTVPALSHKGAAKAQRRVGSSGTHQRSTTWTLNKKKQERTALPLARPSRPTTCVW